MRRIATAVAAAGLALAGCGGDGDETRTFTEPLRGIEVKRGERFVISLEVNASVGLDWRPVAVPAALALVELERTSTDYPEERRAGAAGQKLFEYEARRKGRQTLIFQLLFRGRPEERRTLNVTVE